jgi:hypothetical protein
MTATGRHIIEDFEKLPDLEKHEVLADILRISGYLDYPEVSETELVVAADAIFLEYDRREANE